MPTHVNFIGRMKRSQGNYTDDQTARCCELGGDFSKNLDTLFSTNIAASHEPFSGKDQVSTLDVQAMVEEHIEEELFSCKPGRNIRGLEKIRHGWALMRPKDVFGRVEKHLENFHLWREFID